MTPTPAAPSGELPPLPVKQYEFTSPKTGWFTADQMREYGRLCRAAVSQAAPEQATIWYDAKEGPEFISHMYDDIDLIRITGANKKFGNYTTALAAPSGAPKQEAQQIPEGCAIDGKGTTYHNVAEMYHRCEEGESLHMWLDDKGVPRSDDEGKVFSPVGRVMRFANLAAASTVQSAPVLPDLSKQLAAMRSAFHINMLRAFPEKTHEEIGAEIDRAVGAAQSTPVQVDGQQEQTLQPSCDSALHAEPASQRSATSATPKLAHGHRDDHYLLANCRRLLGRQYCRTPNWVIASELFATGSNSAREICVGAGIDPNGVKVARFPSPNSRALNVPGVPGHDDSGAVQAVALPVAAAPEQQP